MDKQSNYTLYTPNEIFEELKNSGIKTLHLPFTYSYYFLVSYLYKQCAYHYITPNNNDIKMYLGLCDKYRYVDYIIKKGGELDQLLFTQTTTNYPVGFEYDEEGYIEFDLLQDEESYIKEMYMKRHSNNYNIKYPVKCFSRYPVDDLNCLDGTYYQMLDTHRTELSTFKFMLSNSELGVNGFYLYQFLLYKCDKFEKYTGTIKMIQDELPFTERYLYKYLKLLKDYGCIQIESTQTYNSKGKLVKRNEYTIKHHSQFKLTEDSQVDYYKEELELLA